jgi:cysteine desulfurase/selenocysteine lyase
MHNIERYEHQITEYALRKLKTIPRLKLIGSPKNRISVLSFVIEGIENEVIGKALNNEGIAVRVGHHCAQPILRKMGHETAVRPSLAFYNTYEEVDFLVETLKSIERRES